MYDYGAVSGYAGGWSDGAAGGTDALHAPTSEGAMRAVKGAAITGAAAGIMAVLEGYQNNGIGGELKIAKKVPVSLVGALGFHLAGMMGVGEAVGIGDDSFHDVGNGLLAVWAVNRGHAFGQERGKEMAKDKKDTKGSGGAVPRRAFGVPAYQPMQQNVYPQYAGG
jgi:hypothetical protein